MEKKVFLIFIFLYFNIYIKYNKYTHFTITILFFACGPLFNFTFLKLKEG